MLNNAEKTFWLGFGMGGFCGCWGSALLTIAIHHRRKKHKFIDHGGRAAPY